MMTKARFGIRQGVISILVLMLALSSCGSGGGGPVPKPPVDPILYAVILPGSPPTFARKSPSGPVYEALPRHDVILRMANPWPESWESIKIILTYSNGTVSDRLQYVRTDDIPTKQSLEFVGFYEVEADVYGYSVIVVPPNTERRGAGFDIAMTNIASNPPPGTSAESKPLNITIRPVASRTNPSAVFFDCGEDFQAFDGDWHYNCKEGASIVLHNFTLEGWLTGAVANCLSGLCVEDFIYGIIPNVDFIDAFYGPSGMFRTLAGSNPDPYAGVVLPGDVKTSTTVPLPFMDMNPAPGKSVGVNLNSFVLPVNHADPDSSEITFKVELNAWHIADEGSAFSRHWKGRGPAPTGWIEIPAPPDRPGEATAWANVRWPYNPRNPDNGSADLQAGDYVRINGTLWQDSSHLIPGWEDAFPGHGGWLEIHPADWIERVPPPANKKTPILVQDIFLPGSAGEKTVTFKPDRPQQAGEVLRCRELMDSRFTSTGIARTTKISPQDVTVSVYLPAPDGRFKAVYLVWWEQDSAPDTTCSS